MQTILAAYCCRNNINYKLNMDYNYNEEYNHHESVNVRENYDVEYWTNKLGVSREQLLEAVNSVGIPPEAVRK